MYFLLTLHFIYYVLNAVQSSIYEMSAFNLLSQKHMIINQLDFGIIYDNLSSSRNAY